MGGNNKIKAISFWYKPDKTHMGSSPSVGKYPRILWPSNTVHEFPWMEGNNVTGKLSLVMGDGNKKVNKWAINGTNQTLVNETGTTVYSITAGDEESWHHIYIEYSSAKSSCRFLKRGGTGDGSDYWNTGYIDDEMNI